MTSLQERLQLKRMPLDKWSVREQLCLASAVSCSGDQNWMSVSRSLKILCGANRPTDWFSQKSCAVQYGELLENVETPKRKKRTTLERDTQVAETPTESILRKLTQERITELKIALQNAQEEYLKIKEDISMMQNVDLDGKQLCEIWSQIEDEQELKIFEQEKHAQLLKEREERKNELQRVWRPAVSNMQNSQVKPPQLNLSKLEDNDDESSIKQGTSPLLTSLLKSPSPAPTVVATNIQSTNNTPCARVTAPTITNLLTGNTANASTIASFNQPFQIIQNTPLTGPVPTECVPQVVQSPSQEAPTLSMLLENKVSIKDSSSNTNFGIAFRSDTQVDEFKQKQTVSDAMDTEDGDISPVKDEDQQLMEVFNGLIPDNIDELADILTNNNAIILNPELLEEESILQNVESLIDEQEQEENDQMTEKRFEEVPRENQAEKSKNSSENLDLNRIQDEVKEENEYSLNLRIIPKLDNSSSNESSSQIITEVIPSENNQLDKNSSDNKENGNIEIKIENEEQSETSDDSNDNTCLQSLKKQIQESSQSCQPIRNKGDKVEEKNVVSTEKFKPNLHETITPDIYEENHPKPEEKKEIYIEPKSDLVESVIDNSEVIIIPEDDEIIESTMKVKNELDKKNTIDIEHKNSNLFENKNVKKDIESETEAGKVMSTIEAENLQHPCDHNMTITIVDTDDDSPIEVIKEDKSGKTKRDYSRKKLDSSSEKKSDDINDDNRMNLSIRKLKERERSESPLIDDDGADSVPRTRRRYSSTPVIDSIPNSPASSDDREYKAWKRSILMIHNKLITHRSASIFVHQITEDTSSNYKTIVLRPIDLQIIKRNVESGVTRTTVEFQRDILLMCSNAIMFNKKNSSVMNMAREMIADSTTMIENLTENIKRDAEKVSGSSSAIKSRRKGHRVP